MIDPTTAADRLEGLLPSFNEAVKRLREDGPGQRYAYAMVYELRKYLGYIVREMGSGVPPSNLSTDVVIELRLENGK